MFLSEKYSLSISGHRDIEFVDIPLNTDVPLYIDPALLAAGTDVYAKSAWKSVQSFFYLLFDYCSKENFQGISDLLPHVGESNETHLGLSRKYPVGKGASKKILLPILRDMIEKGLFTKRFIQEPNDLLVFAPNFSEDRMSDVIFNIIRDIACIFTIEQCVKHGIPLDTEYGYSRYHWRPISRSWGVNEWPIPLDTRGHPVVLLPKTIVSKSYLYRASWYLQHFVLSYRQKVHFDAKSHLCHETLDSKGNFSIKPPYKKEIRQEEVNGRVIKDYISEVTLSHPQLIEDFRKTMDKQRMTTDQTLSNAELDAIVYKSGDFKIGA